MSGRVRVLVVEDSLTVRKRIVEVLSSDSGLEVVGETGGGREAIALCERLRPDVVTLDMVLGDTHGVEVTEHVMAYFPTPILIVSASLNRGEVFKTFDALAAGAVDVLDKPTGDAASDLGWEGRLVATVKRVSRIRVITHPRARLALNRREGRPSNPAQGSELRAVAIGASTGGPAALVEILRKLPESFPLPIVLVIHIGMPFGEMFAAWLDGQSALRVRVVTDGTPLPEVGTPGVLMAPADQHIVLRGTKLYLSSEPERHSCRPSVDVLFESVARELGKQAVGCLLTGMGRDGAAGLLAIRRAGGVTLVQDEVSSVVFGMPREAIQLGAAQHVVALQRVAGTLLELAGASPP